MVPSLTKYGSLVFGGATLQSNTLSSLWDYSYNDGSATSTDEDKDSDDDMDVLNERILPYITGGIVIIVLVGIIVGTAVYFKKQ